MPRITDDYMREMLTKTREYTVVLLWPTEKRAEPGADPLVWEHARRNFELRADGLLSIVCPINGSSLSGVGIFDATLERTREIMDGDPAVQAGLFSYETHRCRSFPGDALPG